jgi:hypothetical protein
MGSVMETVAATDNDMLTRLRDIGQTPLAEIESALVADIVANLLGHTADYEQVPVARFGSAI